MSIIEFIKLGVITELREYVLILLTFLVCCFIKVNSLSINGGFHFERDMKLNYCFFLRFNKINVLDFFLFLVG